MALVRLVLRLAFRNRARSLIMALGVGVTLLAFLLLRTLVASWYTANDAAQRTDRMVIRHKVSITFPLFTPQAEKIRELPGVLDVSWLCWLGAIYIEERNKLATLAVDLPSYLRIYPELLPPPEQLQALLEDPTGAMAGDKLAKRFGWKIGDRITMKGTYYPGDWEFTLRAIYPLRDENEDRSDYFFLHWKYLNDKLPGGNHVQRILARVTDASVAKDIDALFMASESPTKTESELVEQQMWASWGSAVVAAINVGSGFILVLLILVLGNGMAMAARESTRDYGTLRAIGFKSRHITALVLGEGLALSVIGVCLGLLVAPGMLEGFGKLMADQMGGEWELELDPGVVAIAVLVAIATSMFASAWPAWRSSRLRVVEALRSIA